MKRLSLIFFLVATLIAACSSNTQTPRPTLTPTLAPTPTSEPSTVVRFIPDEPSEATIDLLGTASTIIQNRLADTVGNSVAKLGVDKQIIRMEVFDHRLLPIIEQLATQKGEIVFWDSAEPLPDGSPVPANVQVLLGNAQISQARATQRESTGQWEVSLILTTAGKDTLATYTTKNVGRYLIIAVDGQVLTAPRIQSAIPDGKPVLAGNDEATAKILVALINHGVLPLKLHMAPTN